jgi:hypothetical protein
MYLSQLLYNNKLEAFGMIKRRIGIRLIHRVDYFFMGLLLGFVLGAITISLFLLASFSI